MTHAKGRTRNRSVRGALFALLLTSLCSAPLAAADVAGSFVSAGQIAEPANEISGTPLPDGRVLIFGSWKAQVYAPQSSSWEAPIPFQGGHFGGTSALLADGRVLVVGTASTSNSPPAEIIDPATSQVVTVAGVVVRRYGAYLMTRADGKVVIWGGFASGTSGPPLSTSEIFDPITNSISTFSVPVPARWNAASVKLEDGRYLIAGGSIESGAVQLQAVLYDPNTNTASSAGPQTRYFLGQSVARLQDGKVLLFGGRVFQNSAFESTDLVEVYDPQTGVFTAHASMRAKRAYSVTALFPDGKILIVGGYGWWNEALTSAEIYDPVTTLFSWVGNNPLHARVGGVAVPIDGGRAVIAGGRDAQGPLGEAELFIADKIMSSSFD